MNTIDLPKLKTDLKTTTAALCQMKARYRESGQPRVGWIDSEGGAHKDWRPGCGIQVVGHTDTQLGRLRAQARLLYMLRSHLRGRVHCQGMTIEEQARQVEVLARSYERPAAAPALAA